MSPALKINLSALLHHLFSIMFPLCLISIHIPAGDYYLRINNTSLKVFFSLNFSILYLLLEHLTAKLNTRKRNTVIENASLGCTPMFPRTFLEESHRNTAAGREVGKLLSFWVPVLLTHTQRGLL